MAIRWVEQRGETDCVIACLAMVTETPYDEVLKEFSAYWDIYKEEGVGDNAFYQYLSEKGYLVQTFKRVYEPTQTPRTPWPPPPFAPVHVLGVDYMGDEHGVVMDADGIIFDPYNENKIGVYDYETVYEIVGIWKK